jgi:uncharacterized protein YbbC (DUF1343 family)
MYFSGMGLGRVMPSPNLPTPETAWLYPGQGIWEGSNVSEGRGTTRPFHMVGASFTDPSLLMSGLMALGLPGLAARKASFQPAFNKWAGQACHGLEFFPLDASFQPFLTSLSIPEIILRRWPGDFRLKEPTASTVGREADRPHNVQPRRLRLPGPGGRVGRAGAVFRQGSGDFGRERSKVMLY